MRDGPILRAEDALLSFRDAIGRSLATGLAVLNVFFFFSGGVGQQLGIELIHSTGACVPTGV